MVKSITLKQWDSLTRKEKDYIYNFGIMNKWQLDMWDLIMILFDIMVDIEFHKYEVIWIIDIGDGETKGFSSENIIDGGFEALKYKLRNLI